MEKIREERMQVGKSGGDFEIMGGEIDAGAGGRREKFATPSVGSRHSVKLLLCRVLHKEHSAKIDLPSVKKIHSANNLFANCFYFAERFYVALGKEVVCRVPDR